MDLNRRGFLGLLGAATAGFALDPARALWVPGRVTTFDLGAGRFDTVAWSRNTLITPEWITREALRVLEHNLRVTGRIHRCYDDTGVLWGRS